MLELATSKDRAEVNRLARQVHELHVSWRPDIFKMPEELFPAELYDQLVKERRLYVAKETGTIAGFVLLKVRDSVSHDRLSRRIMNIDQLCVDEAFRSHGIGTRMMEEVHALAKAFGCTDLQLNVFPQNDAAVSFYQKCGFMICSIDMQRKV